MNVLFRQQAARKGHPLAGVVVPRNDQDRNFDYVALGHIHAAYPVGRETVRYAGSPLCYHFDETRQSVKGPILVELGAKGTEPAIVLMGDQNITHRKIDVLFRQQPPDCRVVRMVTGLAELGIPVLIVPGNHDSGQRMSFCRQDSLLEQLRHNASQAAVSHRSGRLTDQILLQQTNLLSTWRICTWGNPFTVSLCWRAEISPSGFSAFWRWHETFVRTQW